MNKKILILFFTFITISLAAFAEFNPLSDEPIRNPEEFMREYEGTESPEFEYTVGTPQTPPETNIKSTKNYSKIYHELEPANHSYMHSIDPDQYYDMKDTTWSPYPLLRLNSPIYFKSQTIEPGYYLLTPREHKDKWYLLFKQNGKVVHIIPVFERDIVSEGFYEKHLPQPKLTPSQKIHMGFLDFVGKFKSSKRPEPIKSYLEINDLENHFVSLIIYYKNHKYSTIYRTVKL
jgi:hypothetical protein